MLLMLDFDGVLHPVEPADELGYWRRVLVGPPVQRFRHVPALAGLLAEFPEVRLVISSAWQETHPLDELKLLLGPLGPRVVAVTGAIRPTRYESILAWVVRTRYAGEWLALDDDDRGWPDEEQYRLVYCDPEIGLDEATLAELGRRLAQMVGRR
jgi:hypothetical protein